MKKGKNKLQIAALLIQLILPWKQPEAQLEKGYPPGYFRNPLGIPMSLTANFGELRPNHWHMGLDLRTNQKVNQPVYAAAEGYVAYAGIRPLSFGRFLIINHPNGLSTLYAHLNGFFPRLEKYVKEHQQKKESWAVELDIASDLFPVKKGEFIARSGNTGGSQGPHLHFEIRDTKTGRSLNPLLFGFGIIDNLPPVITRLALYDRNISTHRQNPVFIKLKKTGNRYYTVPGKILTGSGKISFAVGTYDRINGAPSQDGIYSGELFVDGTPGGGFILNNIDYDESVYVNAHIDHRYKFNGGPYLQHLSKLPGVMGGVYENAVGDGVIELKDTSEHLVRIEIKDAQNNMAGIFFSVQYKESLSRPEKEQNQHMKFEPGLVNVMEEKGFEVYIPETCLYDTVIPFYSNSNLFPAGAVSSRHRLNDPSIPVHDNFTVRIKPVVIIPETLQNKVLLVREWQGRKSVQNAIWQSGWVSGVFSDFGNFQAYLDTIPPQVYAPGKGKDTLNLSPAKRIVFTPADNFGIKSFRAELNGKWLMFTNDKARSFIYNFDEQCPYGRHELKVRVEDIAGNITEKTWWFKRYPYTPPKKKIVRKKPVRKSTKKR